MVKQVRLFLKTEILNYLWNVFNNSDCELDVRDEINIFQVGELGRSADDSWYRYEENKNDEDGDCGYADFWACVLLRIYSIIYLKKARASLSLYLWNKSAYSIDDTLDNCNKGEKYSVHGKHDIGHLNRIHTSWMTFEVFMLFLAKKNNKQ